MPSVTSEGIERYVSEYDDVWDMWVIMDRHRMTDSDYGEEAQVAHTAAVDDAEAICECLNTIGYVR